MKTFYAWVWAGFAASVCSSACAVGSDELWEMNITIKSELQNTTMQPMKSCMPKNSPIPHDKHCKMSSTGSPSGRFSAVTECPGPPPSTIRFEGSRTSNTMQGTMTVVSSGTTMVQEFTGKVVGSCDAATFAGGAPMGAGPSAGANRPSFDPSALPARRQNPGVTAPAEQTPPAPAPDNANPMDAAKKALGGLLRF